ncbi:MAG: GNAT family N-acetyltransferase [Lachnospiraceae bacterium]|nr:GNAT family N-acetyltransferase [Lachnospiraceae bacterium]
MIIEAGKDDVSLIAGLAVLLWNDNSIEDLIEEFSRIIINDNAKIFISYKDDIPIGFAQCQLRHGYVEGTGTSPVGYLEGIFVKEGFRRKGYAGELLAACEQWAHIKGCKEFASDCELDNMISVTIKP